MKNVPWKMCLVSVLALGSCKFLVDQIVDWRKTWPNGERREQGTLTGGKQNGPWTLFFEDGQKRCEGTYKDARQIGQWTYYYENGNLKRSGTYSDDGLREGYWLFNYENSSPKSSGNYLRDNPDGYWTFYRDSGSMIKEGSFDAGKQSGYWRYYQSAGKPKAAGICYQGDRIGPWKITEDGVSIIQDFGTKPGIELVRQVWRGTDSLRRVGVLKNGKAEGRWVSFHPNGTLRLTCGFVDGVASGYFEARSPAGSVFANGVFDEGNVAPKAMGVVDGAIRDLAAGPLVQIPSGIAPWSQMSAIDSWTPEQKLSMFVNETRLEPGVNKFVAAVIAPSEKPKNEEQAPKPKMVFDDIDEKPTVQSVGSRALTSIESKKLNDLVDTMEDAKRSQKLRSKDIYKPAPNAPKPSGVGRRKNLEGKPLPFQVMKGVDGKDLDLSIYRGKKRLMLVVLRGFLGEVCIYCVAQTKALAKARPKLEAANVEVLVLYPGPRENEEAFRELYEDEFGEGAPPYRVFYDPGLKLVTKIGIEGDLASPTTILIDEEGLVQYAYVGEHRADRPATNTLIKLIEEMKQ